MSWPKRKGPYQTHTIPHASTPPSLTLNTPSIGTRQKKQDLKGIFDITNLPIKSGDVDWEKKKNSYYTVQHKEPFPFLSSKTHQLPLPPSTSIFHLSFFSSQISKLPKPNKQTTHIQNLNQPTIYTLILQLDNLFTCQRGVTGDHLRRPEAGK